MGPLTASDTIPCAIPLPGDSPRDCTNTKSITLWNADDGKELKKLTGHTGGVDGVAVCPDGRRLVSAGADKTVRLWDADTGKELRCFRGHAGAVRAVAVSPDGKTALSGGEDHTARLWALPAE